MNRIKRMFEITDQRYPIQEEQKQQVMKNMFYELPEQRNPSEQIHSILVNQFFYMDKSAFVVYCALIILEIIFVIVFRHIEIDTNAMITFCMIGSGVLSAVAILLLNQRFFGKMAELGATCYFSTKQSIAAGMIGLDTMNLMMLLVIALYVVNDWNASILQVGMYILTSFLLSHLVMFGILSTEAGRNHSYMLFICGILLSIGYAMISEIPSLFGAEYLKMWGVACVVMVFLFAFEIRYFFQKVEKGELLCMN